MPKATSISRSKAYFGSKYGDTLYGNAAPNLLIGGDGNDRLFGLGGNDELLGVKGNDILTGAVGREFLTGGAGLDDFVYNSAAETGKTSTTRDIIADFKHCIDDIVLTAIAADGGGGINRAFKFVAQEGAKFTGVKDSSSGTSRILRRMPRTRPSSPPTSTATRRLTSRSSSPASST